MKLCIRPRDCMSDYTLSRIGVVRFIYACLFAQLAEIGWSYWEIVKDVPTLSRADPEKKIV